MIETTKVDCVSLGMKTLSIPTKMVMSKDFVTQIVMAGERVIEHMVGATAGMVMAGGIVLGIDLDCMQDITPGMDGMWLTAGEILDGILGETHMQAVGTETAMDMAGITADVVDIVLHRTTIMV
jgi:hypothetical protein